MYIEFPYVKELNKQGDIFKVKLLVDLATINLLSICNSIDERKRRDDDTSEMKFGVVKRRRYADERNRSLDGNEESRDTRTARNRYTTYDNTNMLVLSKK